MLLDAVPAAVFIAHDVECHKMSGSRTTQKLLGLLSHGKLLKILRHLASVQPISVP